MATACGLVTLGLLAAAVVTTGCFDMRYEYPTEASPVQVGSDADWSHLCSGGAHSCAVRENGTLWCWGRNFMGELGVGDDEVRAAPEQVGEHADWQTVQCGSRITCGIREDGSLWCWGFNEQRTVAPNTPEDDEEFGPELVPVQIGEQDDWTSVDAGTDYSCGTREGGTLWCWGNNYDGQLGVGDDEWRTDPTRVGAEEGWSSVRTARGHSCGIREDATLWCWGREHQGRLGIDSEAPGSVKSPQQVEGDDWDQVAPGSHHTCGLRDEGTLWCWGTGEYGTLGDEAD